MSGAMGGKRVWRRISSIKGLEKKSYRTLSLAKLLKVCTGTF